MPRVPLSPRRILPLQCLGGSRSYAAFSNRGGAAPRRDGREVIQRDARARAAKSNGSSSDKSIDESKQPSLIEQLFPEETKRYEEEKRRASRDVPRLPLDKLEPLLDRGDDIPDRVQQDDYGAIRVIRRPNERPLAPRKAYQEVQYSDVEPSVLVLRHASPNLTEEDFRRLIPQGKHMQGWTLERGDIIKVIPGRDLATLEQKSYYYVLFSSELSAYTYQGQTTRTFRLIREQTRTSITSPISPPPGYTKDGIDADAAIKSFGLVPASQTMELRQLRPPLSPLMESINQHQGYASLVQRGDKMPFEARLTLEGPQLSKAVLRWILLTAGKERAYAWSGGDEVAPKITKWEPFALPSPRDYDSRDARRFAKDRSERDQMMVDDEKLMLQQTNYSLSASAGASEEEAVQKRRTSLLVYILGFHTENAAQTFLRYWHRRPMKSRESESQWDDEGHDLPPVANVEMLW